MYFVHVRKIHFVSSHAVFYLEKKNRNTLTRSQPPAPPRHALQQLCETQWLWQLILGWFGERMRNMLFLLEATPPKFNSEFTPEKLPKPNRKGASSNHHFSGASC